MKLLDILNLKKSLGERLSTLQKELGLKDNEHQVQELTEFRSRTGVWKLIYYFSHKSRIRAAAEYEALIKIHEELPNTQGLDPSLLDVFHTPEKPTAPYESRLADCMAEIAGRKTLDKNEYWKKLYQTLNESKAPADPLLAAYIKKRKDLPLCEPEINIKAPEVLTRPPSFLWNLPDSGTKADYLTIASAHAEPPAPSNTLQNIPLVQPLNVTTKATIFWIIPCTYMSDIQESINQWEEKIQVAGTAIKHGTETSLECMRNFVDTLKGALNAWKPAPAEKPAQTPVEIPVQTNLMTFIASFIPETSVPAPAPEAATTIPAPAPASKARYRFW